MLRITIALISIALTNIAGARAGGIDFGETQTRFQAQSRSVSVRARSENGWRHAMAWQPVTNAESENEVAKRRRIPREER